MSVIDGQEEAHTPEESQPQPLFQTTMPSAVPPSHEPED